MFGKKLKALREGKNLSQEELGLALGLSRPTITKYERNERQPDLKTFMQIADYFSVSADYLLDRSYANTPEIIPQITSLITVLDKELQANKPLPETIGIYKEYKTQIDRLLLDLLSYRVSD